MKKIRVLFINLILLSMLQVLPEASFERKNIAFVTKTDISITNSDENVTEEAEKITEVVSSDEKIQEENSIIYDETKVSSRSLSREREKTEYVRPTCYSENLYEYIKAKESFKPEAYLLEGEKYYTIGYGHHGEDVSAGQVISEEQADRMLRADLKGVSDFVLKYCDYFDITQNQLDALTSFAYNGGIGFISQITDQKRRGPTEIVEHFTAYTKSSSESYRKGLTIRRNEEKNIFIGGFNNENEEV